MIPYHRTSYPIAPSRRPSHSGRRRVRRSVRSLLATFPILTGSDLQARLQAAVIVALAFPSELALPTLAGLVGLLGMVPFAARVGLAVLNGVLWATVFLALRRVAQRWTAGWGRSAREQPG